VIKILIEFYEDRLAKQKAEFKIMQEEKFSVGELEISRSDLDYQTALNAYRNTSFSSDKRAEMEQSAYLGAMQAMYDSLEPYAKNEEQKQILNTEMERYQKDFLHISNFEMTVAFYINQANNDCRDSSNFFGS